MTLDQSALLELLGELQSTDVSDRVRLATQKLYQELIDAEATAFIGAAPYERSEGRVAVRNGSRPRTLATTAGDLDSRLEPQNSVSGPLARTARDLELVLGAVAGTTGDEAIGWRLELPRPTVESLAGLRVGVWLSSEVAPATREMRQAIERLAEDLASCGARLVPLTTVPGGDREGLERFDRLAQAEIAHSADPQAVRSLAGRSGTIGQLVHETWQDAEAQRRVREQWAEQVFQAVDVVLAPAS